MESSNQEPWKGVIKRDQGWFSPIKILDPGRKRFCRQRVCDYPWYVYRGWRENPPPR